MKNFHVPLPAELYQQLHTHAKQAKQPATQLVREAITRWLAEQRRLAINRQIEAFAAQWAGSEWDLDEALEATGAAHLRESKA